MPIIARCPNPDCGQEIGIPDDSAGKRLMCPYCETEFVAGKKKSTPQQEAAQKQPSPPQKQPPAKQKASRQPDGQRSPGRLREHTTFRAPSQQKKPAPQRSAESRYARHQSAPWVQVVYILALVVAIGATVVGAIVLIKPFGHATIAGSPRELYNNLVWAVQNDNYDKLRKLLAQDQLDLANQYSMKIQEAVEKRVGSEAVTEGDPLRNMIVLLQSPMFNIETWEFKRQHVDKKAGQIIYDDASGKSRGIKIELEDVGWRLNLTSFVLDRIQEYQQIDKLNEEAQQQKPQQPQDQQAHDEPTESEAPSQPE